VFHADFRGVFNLRIGAAQSGDEPTGRHGASHAHFSLAAHLRAADGRILLIKNADGAEARKKRQNAFVIGIGNEALIVKRHGGNHAGSAVGGRGDDATAGRILFIDCHGVSGEPVERASGSPRSPEASFSRRRTARRWARRLTLSPPGKIPSVAMPRSTQPFMFAKCARCCPARSAQGRVPRRASVHSRA